MGSRCRSALAFVRDFERDLAEKSNHADVVGVDVGARNGPYQQNDLMGVFVQHGDAPGDVREAARVLSQKLGTYLLSLGQSLVNGVLSLGVALVLTVYLLLDGRRTYEWLVAFAPAAHRPRVRQTAMEARTAILAYVRGNMLTSALAGICAYVAMRLLHVPAAMLLGLITAIFDLLPVIGIFMSTIPAVLLGLTVSTWVGVGVALYHGAYNIVENYYITPKVYGRELRLSDLAVILALAVGAEIGGVVGALVFLPIAALYPAVERIWLRDRVAPETVQDHRRIENSAER